MSHRAQTGVVKLVSVVCVFVCVRERDVYKVTVPSAHFSVGHTEIIALNH